MSVKTLKIESVNVHKFGADAAEFAIIQPIDARAAEDIAAEAEMIKRLAPNIDFSMYAFEVDDWNGDLSPWQADVDFAKQPFKGNAHATLDFVENALVPRIEAENKNLRGIVIGGYSLAALFSLWAAYERDLFCGVCSASASVWYPGWSRYISDRTINARCVYISLGDTEKNTKNKILAAVEEATGEQYARIFENNNIRTVFEWNEGNHFRDAEKRTAKGFAWVFKNLKDEQR